MYKKKSEYFGVPKSQQGSMPPLIPTSSTFAHMSCIPPQESILKALLQSQLPITVPGCITNTVPLTTQSPSSNLTYTNHKVNGLINMNQLFEFNSYKLGFYQQNKLPCEEKNSVDSSNQNRHDRGRKSFFYPLRVKGVKPEYRKYRCNTCYKVLWSSPMVHLQTHLGERLFKVGNLEPRSKL